MTVCDIEAVTISPTSVVAVAEDVFHIIGDEDLVVAQREAAHRPASLADSGFVHLSGLHQILRPANLLYRGRTDLSLLRVDPHRLPKGALRWEPGSHGEDEDFPHLYAALPISAVTEYIAFPPGADGTFVLPVGLR